MGFNQSSSRRTADGLDVIPPERRMPFSRSFPRPAEIADAEFEVIGEAARAPSMNNDNRKRFAEPVVEASPARSGARDIFQGHAEKAARRRSAGGFIGIAALLALGLYAGVHMVGAMVGKDGGLVITDLHQSPVDADGYRIMELTGTVENHGGKALALPPIVAELTSEHGAVTRSAISLGSEPLAGGKTARFFMRIPYPGGKHPDVRVSFAAKGV